MWKTIQTATPTLWMAREPLQPGRLLPCSQYFRVHPRCQQVPQKPGRGAPEVQPRHWRWFRGKPVERRSLASCRAHSGDERKAVPCKDCLVWSQLIRDVKAADT